MLKIGDHSRPDPRYPHVIVPITQLNGNIYVLTGATLRALRRAGVPAAVRDELIAQVKAAQSYDEAIQVLMAWVEVE